MADGYGYAAEGDTNTATLMCAAQSMIGDAHFTRCTPWTGSSTRS